MKKHLSEMSERFILLPLNFSKENFEHLEIFDLIILIGRFSYKTLKLFLFTKKTHKEKKRSNKFH